VFFLDCFTFFAITDMIFRNSFFRNLGIGNVGIISSAGININLSEPPFSPFLGGLGKYHKSKTTLITSQYHFFSRQKPRS